MQALATAKINLSLEVLGRRDDGYHQVTTVLHAIDLTDRLTFEASHSLGLKQTTPPVPTERNLVFKAATLLQHETGCTLGAAITLEKGIPMASGLGGGSSDAAATLKALNVLWDLKLSAAKLSELAASLGSDVPFFVEGGCALAEDRGEVVTPLPPIDGWWAVVLRPAVHLPDKTAYLYGLLTEDDFSDGAATEALVQRLRDGTASTESVANGRNAFGRAADEAFPGLDKHRKALLEAGAPFVRITGSGPALYTVMKGQEEGAKILTHLKDNGHEAYLARLLGPEDA